MRTKVPPEERSPRFATPTVPGTFRANGHTAVPDVRVLACGGACKKLECARTVAEYERKLPCSSSERREGIRRPITLSRERASEGSAGGARETERKRRGAEEGKEVRKEEEEEKRQVRVVCRRRLR